MEEKIEQIKNAILTYKIKDIDALVKTALDAGIIPNSILDDGMIAAMNEIGEGFKNNKIYMPQMLMAAKTMQNGLAVLKPHLSKGSDRKNGGKAVVGSVLGDVHDIGKNLVAIMLEGSGFQVTDLGADVPYQKFVEAVKADPDIIVVAASSSMTPTRPALRDIVTNVRTADTKGAVAIMVGGATMDQQYSDEIGADIYTKDAASAAERAKEVVSGKSVKAVSEESRDMAFADEEASAAVETAKNVAGEEKKVLRHLMEAPVKAARAGCSDNGPLSVKENLVETLKHEKGCPDRFVNQYEFFDVMLFDPVLCHSRNLTDELFQPKAEYVDGWGVHNSIPTGSGGSHPEHGPGKTVLTDLTKWQDQLRIVPPTSGFTDAEWAAVKKEASETVAAGKHVGLWMAPGLFERVHFLMGMKEALVEYYEHPDEMHDLIDFLTEWEIKALDENMAQLGATVLFHHDDWGTALNSFLDPDTHRKFFLEPYKKIYRHFRDLGGEIVIHHSDSWAANLVPTMIDVGADIWQGAIDANNIPQLIDEYGNRIVFMGGIDDAIVDISDWKKGEVKKYTRQKIGENGSISYIPCLTRGLGVSIYPGVYDAISETISQMSKERF